MAKEILFDSPMRDRLMSGIEAVASDGGIIIRESKLFKLVG